jgi:5'-nucleotidase
MRPNFHLSPAGPGSTKVWSMRFTLAALALTFFVIGCTSLAPTGDAERHVELRILAINDFHGNLETPRNDLGGAAYLAAHLRRAEAEVEHAVIVSAGDLIGATPLISSLFHDEPTIEFANMLGLDYNGVGNHEFDEGKEELLRMQHGGPHPVDGESPAGPFHGAEFGFLAANVIDVQSGETLLPPYAIRRFGGVPVAFIGLTLEGTPAVASAAAVAGLEFMDEVDTIDSLIEEIRRQGVEAIVVVIHQGGFQGDGGEDDCNDFTGPIVDIVKEAHPAVDLFVSGHTHRHYLCRVNGRPVTSTGTAGRFYTDISGRLDRASGDLTVVDFDNVPVTQDIPPAADVEALVSRYRSLVETVSGQVVGTITGDFTKNQDDSGQSQLGGLIADAQLAATQYEGEDGADVAFMNAGGIRSNLLYSATGGEQDGEVTFAEVFSVHPFGNHLVTMTLTGEQVLGLLEQQWTNAPARNMMTPSQGFSYTWRRSADPGIRVDRSSVRLDGQPLDPAGSYRVTVNSFLAEGGDGFTILAEGTERNDGMADVDALQDYLKVNSPLSPPELGRIRRLP